MYSLVRILWKYCAGEDNWEAENGNDISGGYNSSDARPLLTGNSATTESRIHGRHSGSNLPVSSLPPHKHISSTAKESSGPPTRSAVNPEASSPLCHKLPTSTESSCKEITSSASALKPTISSKVSVEESLSLNVTNRQQKGMSVQVEKGRTHVCAIPRANEALVKKESVPLSPSTSKVPTQSALRPTAFSTKAAVQGLPYSESSTSTLKTTTSSKASLEASLALNPTLMPNASSSKQNNRKTENLSSSKQNNQQGKAMYTWAGKDKTPVYSIPKDIENMIKNDIVPDILLKPLSPSNYKDYFAALLCAEEYYIQKWNGFTLEDVSLELHEAEIIKRSSRDNRSHENQKKENKIFVAFKIDSVPERRPFLLSRDFVFARPSGEQRDPFKGFVCRVKRSTHVLVEFGKDFHSQHHSFRRYDVSFSFNRVCLKRAHHANLAVSDLLFRSFIFPDHISRENTPTWPTNWCSHRLSVEQKSAVRQILSSRGPPPYLVEGPLCVTNADGFPSYDSNDRQLSETGIVVKEAVVQILRSSSLRRVLICAPINKTCDVLMRGLVEEIPESVMFRANAAFREIDEVPIDILDLSSFEGECFTCPSLEELKKYRVIMSTFISSFRLHSEGLAAGHFSHIFLVDASSASEPETMVALSNFADEGTTVVVTGASGNSSRWIRSDIARKHGLSLSYFQRLSQSKPYKNLDPMLITKLVR